MKVGLDRYEVSQTATRGPILPSPWGIPWQDHLELLGLVFVIVVIGVWVTYYNLTILYASNPDYGRDLEMERAFCLDLDELFISSRYEWSKTENVCRSIEAEVKR